MGLDMYLNRRVYVGAEFEHRNVTGSIDISINGKKLPIEFKKISEVIERVGYWRKANPIHNWFVLHVQSGKDDCGDYYVSTENLKQLLAECKKVKKTPVLAAEILPTKPGFFFGGTEYDEYYMDDIDDTIEIIESVLADEAAGNNGDIYYHSSW